MCRDTSFRRHRSAKVISINLRAKRGSMRPVQLRVREQNDVAVHDLQLALSALPCETSCGSMTDNAEPELNARIDMYLDDIQHHHSQSPWGVAAEAMAAARMAVPQIMHLFNYKPERTRFL